MTEETTENQDKRTRLTRLDSGVLIQRALMTNRFVIEFAGYKELGIPISFRHGMLPNKPSQFGWWLLFSGAHHHGGGSLQIPDQTVEIVVDEYEKIQKFIVIDLQEKPIEITLPDRALTLSEIGMSFQEFIDSQGSVLANPFEFKRNRDSYEQDGRFPSQIWNVTPAMMDQTATQHQDDESADFRWLRHMKNRGQSDQEMLVYAKTRVMEIMNQIVVHTPWYKPEDLQKVLEEQGHNLKILIDFILSLKKPS